MKKKLNIEENKLNNKIEEIKKYKKIDARTIRRTGRIVQFATSVTIDFDRTIRELAREENLMICEVLERPIEAYIRERKSKFKRKQKNN